MKPSISVLMPVFNAKPYLSDAIKSILDQTYVDFELILLDDCSTDGSEDVIKSFKDNRIVYHKNEINAGLANNLNTGLKMAKGEFIARMDADDISLSNRFKTQIDFLKSNSEIDLCSCAVQMFGDDDKIWIRDSHPEQVKITMMFYSAVLHPTCVFRKEVFIKHKLFYDQQSFPAEDYDLWSRAIFYCKMVNLSEVMYLYRRHLNQITSTNTNSTEKSREIQIKYLKRALPDLSIKDVEGFVDEFISHGINSLNEIKEVKSRYLKIISVNALTQFFNQQMLTYTLKKHFQQKVFIFLQHFKIKKIGDVLAYLLAVFELRSVLIVKLLLNKK